MATKRVGTPIEVVVLLASADGLDALSTVLRALCSPIVLNGTGPAAECVD